MACQGQTVRRRDTSPDILEHKNRFWEENLGILFQGQIGDFFHAILVENVFFNPNILNFDQINFRIRSFL